MPKTIGILGKKIGMTRIFDELGNVVPVTVIEAGPCKVLQVKSEKTDGYNAIQVGFIEKKGFPCQQAGGWTCDQGRCGRILPYS